MKTYIAQLVMPEKGQHFDPYDHVDKKNWNKDQILTRSRWGRTGYCYEEIREDPWGNTYRILRWYK